MHCFGFSLCINNHKLEGNSGICQFEQVDFLKRLCFGEFPISENTTATLKEILLLEEDEHINFSGKPEWFVGCFEPNDKVWFVATNI